VNRSAASGNEQRRTRTNEGLRHEPTTLTSAGRRWSQPLGAYRLLPAVREPINLTHLAKACFIVLVVGDEHRQGRWRSSLWFDRRRWIAMINALCCALALLSSRRFARRRPGALFRRHDRAQPAAWHVAAHRPPSLNYMDVRPADWGLQAVAWRLGCRCPHSARIRDGRQTQGAPVRCQRWPKAIA
jgi:hypothetical protein